MLKNTPILAIGGVDTAENEPRKVHLIFKPWDSTFTEPPHPAQADETLDTWREAAWAAECELEVGGAGFFGFLQIG